MKTTNRKFFIVFVMGVLLFVQACVVGTPVPAPTATLEPTNTPAPTDTPLPTATVTPTPPPTFTPEPTRDATATAAAQSTEVAQGVLTELDPILAKSGIAYQGGSLLWAQDKPIYVDVRAPGGVFYALKNVIVSDFIIKSDITWETTGLVFCGIIFRSEPNFKQGKQYQFLYMRFSGLPAWAIEFDQFGEFKNSITDIKFSKSINLDNGAANQVILVAQENEFTVFINGVRQGRFFDYSKQVGEGGVAFLAAEDSGKSTCTFENTFIWALPSSK